MRTAIYARISTVTHSQQHAIEEQINRLRTCLLSRGEAVADEHIFRDEGRSGVTLNRPALDRLRDHVRLGDYDRILVTSPDRFARNYVHQMLLLEELERAGCTVEFLDQPVADTPHDHLLLQIRGAVAEYERALIGDRMRRGRLARYRAGLLLPWTRPVYGYLLDPEHPRDPKGVRVSEAEAAVVRQIFARYLEEGASLSSIVNRLFAHGVASPAGRPRWRHTTVRFLLRNPAYAGAGSTHVFVTCGQTIYCRYQLSYRDLEEMMRERGLSVDHTTVWRWVQRYTPEINRRMRPHLKMSGTSYRLDETYVKVGTEWKYLYRAIDSAGNTFEFMLSARRDVCAAKRFFKKLMRADHRRLPFIIGTDKHASYPEAFASSVKEKLLPSDCKLRRVKYLNNIIE